VPVGARAHTGRRPKCVGSVMINEGQVGAIPGSALFQKDGKPAVWLVTKDGTVQLKPITAIRAIPSWSPAGWRKAMWW
jgi:hypothetical protein